MALKHVILLSLFRSSEALVKLRQNFRTSQAMSHFLATVDSDKNHSIEEHVLSAEVQPFSEGFESQHCDLVPPLPQI